MNDLITDKLDDVRTIRVKQRTSLLSEAIDNRFRRFPEILDLCLVIQ
jgi:hypothetical protein